MNLHSTDIKRLGIIFPTQLEFQPFAALVPELKSEPNSCWESYSAIIQELTIRVTVSYIGPANAAAATENLMATNPDLILHAGAAGAINPNLMPGDLVVGESYKILCSQSILEARRSLLLSNKAIRYSQNGKTVHTEHLSAEANLVELALESAIAANKKFGAWQSPGWPKETPARPPQAVAGTIGSQDGWTKKKDDLEFLRKEFAIDSEDMESAYIAQIAAMHSVPFLAVRAISNNEHCCSLEKSEIFLAISAAAERAALVLELICRKFAFD